MQGLPSCEIVQIDTSQDSAARKQKLLETVKKPELLDKEQVALPQRVPLRGPSGWIPKNMVIETDLVQMEINTGNT